MILEQMDMDCTVNPIGLDDSMSCGDLVPTFSSDNTEELPNEEQVDGDRSIQISDETFHSLANQVEGGILTRAFSPSIPLAIPQSAQPEEQRYNLPEISEDHNDALRISNNFSDSTLSQFYSFERSDGDQLVQTSGETTTLSLSPTYPVASASEEERYNLPEIMEHSGSNLHRSYSFPQSTPSSSRQQPLSEVNSAPPYLHGQILAQCSNRFTHTIDSGKHINENSDDEAYSEEPLNLCTRHREEGPSEEFQKSHEETVLAEIEPLFGPLLKTIKNKKFEPKTEAEAVCKRVLHRYMPIETVSDVLPLPNTNFRLNVKNTKRDPFIVSDPKFVKFRGQIEKERHDKLLKAQSAAQQKREERSKLAEIKAVQKREANLKKQQEKTEKQFKKDLEKAKALAQPISKKTKKVPNAAHQKTN